MSTWTLVQDADTEVFELYSIVLPQRKANRARFVKEEHEKNGGSVKGIELGVHNTIVDQSAGVISLDVGGGRTVVIHQNQSRQNRPGETGHVLWDSGLLLARILESEHRLDPSSSEGHIQTASLSSSPSSPTSISSLTLTSPWFWPPPNMKHARCIELGSGTGCLGISVATALWCPREWIFSDIGDTLVECLRNARENDVVGGSDFENGDGRTKLNVHRSNHYGHESRKRGGQSTKGGNRTQRKSEPHHLKVQFVELDWTDAHAIRNLSTSLFPSSDTDGAARIDFAFATDCVYHESLVGPFVARLKEIHEMSNKRRSENESFVRPTVGYLAQELRSSIVLLELVKQLLEAGFTVYRREASNSSEEGRSGMVLYAIMVES